MRYNNSFILTASISVILGILFALYIDNSDFNLTLNKENLKNLNVSKKVLGENDDVVNNDRNSIPIVLTIDNKYTFPSLVYLTSLMENIGSKTKYEIYIMSPYELPENSQNKFSSLIKKYGKEKLKITLINMENVYVPEVTNPGWHITKTTYFRLYIPLILPEIDKIIYSDVDIINLEDLSELYNIEFEKDIYYYGMIDYIGNLEELKIFNLKLEGYLNSGVLLIDSKNIRKNGIDIKLIDCMVKNRKKLWHQEQTAINVICHKNLRFLPYKYVIFNFFNFKDLVKFNEDQNIKYRRSEDELKEAYIHPFLVHYAGGRKPWNSKISAFKEYWWYYAKKTDFYNEILQYYNK